MFAFLQLAQYDPQVAFSQSVWCHVFCIFKFLLVILLFKMPPEQRSAV